MDNGRVRAGVIINFLALALCGICNIVRHDPAPSTLPYSSVGPTLIPAPVRQ